MRVNPWVHPRLRMLGAAVLIASASMFAFVACTGELNPQPLPPSPFGDGADSGASSSSGSIHTDAGFQSTNPEDTKSRDAAAGGAETGTPPNAPDAADGGDAGAHDGGGAKDGGKDAGDGG